MSTKLNSETYTYRLNQTQRDDVMRAAEHQRLAHIAANEPHKWRQLEARVARRLNHLFVRLHFGKAIREEEVRMVRRTL